MLRLFFEPGDHFDFSGGDYLKASNKLDSHKYVLERVVEAPKNYIQKEYFSEPHEKLAICYTSWMEKQATLEITSPRVNKKKGTSIVQLLNKKAKGETIAFPSKTASSAQQNTANLSNPNQGSKESEVLYIQLEPFTFSVPTMDFPQSITYMSIVYLLAEKVHKALNESYWPRMSPITTEDGLLKFLKRGRTLNEELFCLFKNTFATQKNFQMMPQNLKRIVIQTEFNGDRNLIAEATKQLMKPIINGLYPLKVIRGTEITIEKCQLTEDRNLLLTEAKICIPLEDFSIQYSYSREENRQITLTHSFLMPITLIGSRTNFLIKYLKQFRQF